MSLRLRVALAALTAVGLVLLGAGWVLSARLQSDGLRAVDRELRARVPQVVSVQGVGIGQAGTTSSGTTISRTNSGRAVKTTTVTTAAGTSAGRKPGAAAVPLAATALPAVAPPAMPSTAKPGRAAALGPAPATTAQLLGGTGSFTLTEAAGPAITAGDTPAEAAQLHLRAGLHTRTLGGRRFRLLSLVSGRDRVVLGESLEPVLDRVRTTRTLLLRLGFAALLATGLLGFLAGGLALRPLTALRRAADHVGRDSADEPTFAGDGPAEVVALGGTLQRMLGRLHDSRQETETALEATRRFAGDAGHELRTPLAGMAADLAVVADHTLDAPTAVREAVAGLAAAQQRLAARLDALQLLALGDAGTALTMEDLDLADLAEEAIRSARRQHSGRDIALATGSDSAPVHGWPDGLRALIDNLLRNAVLHAGPQATVRVTVTADDDTVRLDVDDDGPGIPAADRQRIFDRFVRGEGAAAASGSGLGLSIVAQQAALHHGTIEVRDIPGGGARLHLALPARSAGPAPSPA